MKVENMLKLKGFLRKIFSSSFFVMIARYFSGLFFRSSKDYWERRYSAGGNSGAGSKGRLAEYKAEFLNDFVEARGVRSVIELGCGDGGQLALAKYPAYVGMDVSRSAVQRCINRYGDDPKKSFFLYDPFIFHDRDGVLSSDLAISLDVIYHLVEDEVYFLYLKHLFALAKDWVIIYSSNYESNTTLAHVKHRKFTDFIDKSFPGWILEQCVNNKYRYAAGDSTTSSADFFVYARRKEML